MQILESDYMHEDKTYFCIFEMRDFFLKLEINIYVCFLNLTVIQVCLFP